MMDASQINFASQTIAIPSNPEPEAAKLIPHRRELYPLFTGKTIFYRRWLAPSRLNARTGKPTRKTREVSLSRLSLRHRSSPQSYRPPEPPPSKFRLKNCPIDGAAIRASNVAGGRSQYWR